MIAEADPADREITVWTDNESPKKKPATTTRRCSEDIGFDVKLKVLNADNYFTVIGNASTPDLDTGWASWFQDYPHPNDLLPAAALRRKHLPDQRLQPRPVRRPGAERENRTPRRTSRSTPRVEAEYAALDKEFMEQAPWAPYGTGTFPTFVSAAIDLDKVIFNPTFNQDLTSFQFK